MRMLWEFKELPGDTLLGYDQNIVRHTLALSEKRAEPLQWKYFQYLSLLFTEIYLDRFFRDPAQLLADLNTHAAVFDQDKLARDQVSPFEITDLRKLAFWNATGSGKTLLMHANIRQYQHYLDLHGRSRELNRTILLTPNEGLSRQHLEEFEASGIHAEIFSKDQGSLFAGRAVEILEISKLREEMGEKTVAVDAFEGNNLVLIDEGHRGASGETWMGFRNRLCENGFSFEYSATFGQAMKGRKDLEQVYARNILFDYSYRYFYRDGFGKDYRILSLADDSDEAQRTLYFTACLLAFYQQQKLYADDPAVLRPFLLEKPLWVFVGGSVKAVRTSNKRKVSDVVDILLTLATFVQDRRHSVDAIRRLLEGSAGLLDKSGKDIFAEAYPHLTAQQQSADAMFEDILKTLFNAPGTAALHLDHLKGSEGEIALSLGGNKPFGVINVGDAANLCKLCEAHSELVVTEQDFSDSLFHSINEANSTINLLIGSKKFTEGWNSWRVSTMGLMNIGKKEGSEIIQLFGRGVRLKGHGNTLKRSSQLPGVDRPKRIGLLETLNVFGIHADYMRQFREYLEDEGLPGNENPLEFILPTLRSLEDKVLTGKNLTSIRIQEGKDFKRDGPKPTLSLPPDQLLRHPIALDWYPRIEADQSKGLKRTTDAVDKYEGKLEEQHLAFMNFDAIWFELQHFKAERSWYNLNLPREILPDLLAPANHGWYRLFIPREELTFSSFEQVRRWEEIATALL